MKKLLLIVMLVAASVSFAQSASANKTAEGPAAAQAAKAPAAAVVAAAPKKVVVCKYVTTPDGALDHIVIVNSNAIKGFNGTFPYAFADKHISVAIRYAQKGEKSHDISPSECASKAPTLTPRTDNPTLPDTGGSQLPLLLLAFSMIASGSIILMRTSPARFGSFRNGSS